MLNISQLRLTDEEDIQCHKQLMDWLISPEYDPQRFPHYNADAQFAKLAWGLWDALVEEAERVGHPVSWVVFLGDMGADLHAMGIERLKL